MPSFEHNPATKDLLYFEVSRPLDELEDQLLNDFAGRELTMREIYEEHSVGKRFLKNNYKQASQNLSARGAIGASPKPRKNTFADHIRASFPPA